MSINKLLKSAKASLDKKEFEEALKCCQNVFIRDASNYNANVFAGLANLQLGHHDNARRHYKTAIETQPDNPLAWKGLADYYDKHRAVIQEEQLDALDTYTRLLSFVESDAVKSCATLFKMAALHDVLSQHSKVLTCYRRIIATGEGVELLPDKLLSMASYLLNMKDTSLETWEMLVKAFNLVDNDIKHGLRWKFISRGLIVYKTSDSPVSGLHARLVSECEQLLSSNPQQALVSLVQLALWEQVVAIEIQYPCEISVVLPSNQKGWCEQLQDLGDSSLDPSGRDISNTSCALLMAADKKWREAKNLLILGTNSFPILSVLVHISLHDYHTAELEGHKALKRISSLPRSLTSSVQTKLKLCLLCVAIGNKDGEQSKALANELSQLMSGDNHVTALVARGYISAGDLNRAEEVVRSLEGECEGLVCALQGELFLATKSWEQAIDQFSAALKHYPKSSLLHFLYGMAVWSSATADKRPAYASFIQAAKLDPHNGEVFLYLGRYQRIINKSIDRAVKCFQKAVELMPSLTEAAMELGDVLTVTGEEEKAFEVYKRICVNVPPDKASHAWLRTGLYHQSKGNCTEAIKCFQTFLLHVDSNNVQCYECIGDAYLARGSYNSAFNAFHKRLEIDSSSVYCLYQLASIRQLLGQLREAVTEYTAVLELDSQYVPALKGRGETQLALARQALAHNLDPNAVDHISLALKDLTKAAHHCPRFVCLWKLIGDSCFSLHKLPSEVARLSAPVVLQGQSSSYTKDCVMVSKWELFQIGIRAYAQALRLSADSAHCWHDLAVAYYHTSQEDGKEQEKRDNLTTALSAAKKAISLAPNCFLYWNSLGYIAASNGIGDISLAQHCFIRSLQESNNAMAWTNLGTLYLKQGNVKLAHKALSNGQSADPEQVEAWVGQALVAENIGSNEAMDLFRHSTQLGYHPEGTLGYGYWVCNTLSTIDSKLILEPGGRGLNATATTALLLARDELDKFVRRKKMDTCALNYLGLLYELEGLTKQAEKMFRRALDSKPGANEEAIRINLARALSVNGENGEAMSMCASLPQSDPLLRLQLSMTLCMAGQWLDSFKVYETLVTEEGGVFVHDQSAILTAQAMVAFAITDKDTCKALLFKSFQCSPVCAQGLIAMCVLGCLDNDLTLLQAALQEVVQVLESGEDPHLDSSCVNALKTIVLILKNDPQASECVDVIRNVISILCGSEMKSISMAPNLATLHSVFEEYPSPEQRLRMVQKLFHSNPINTWCSSYLLNCVG